MIENNRALSVVAADFEVARLWREARFDPCLRCCPAARFPHPLPRLDRCDPGHPPQLWTTLWATGGSTRQGGEIAGLGV